VATGVDRVGLGAGGRRRSEADPAHPPAHTRARRHRGTSPRSPGDRTSRRGRSGRLGGW
jgi:hypothetical protein